MQKVKNLKLLLFLLTGAFILSGFSSLSAASANLSRSFKTTQSIPDGSIVSLNADDKSYVELANVDNSSQLTGVKTPRNESLLAVNAAEGDVQIATTGFAPTLVSTLNGDIKAGDLIAASPFNGIGMKAPSGERVIGAATTDLNASTPGVRERTVTDKNGKSTQLFVGLAGVNINISTNNVSSSGETEINGLQSLVKSLTGKVVPTYRVIMAMAVVAVALITLITLIYGSIYGSIISIGRNPLARYSVLRTLGFVLVMIAFTAVTASAAVFLLLR